jgi:hypothetical protein
LGGGAACSTIVFVIAIINISRRQTHEFQQV